MRQPILRARGPRLAEAVRSDPRAIRTLATAADVRPSTIWKAAKNPDAGIAKDKAERLAAALGQPARDLFAHLDGTPLLAAEVGCCLECGDEAPLGTVHCGEEEVAPYVVEDDPDAAYERRRDEEMGL